MPPRILLPLAALLLVVVPGPRQAAAQDDLPTILLSRQLAAAEGITVGSVVELGTSAGTGDDGAQAPGSEPSAPRRFRVAGIYEPTPDPQQLGRVPREIRMHLQDLLDVTRPPGQPAGTEFIAGINVALTDPAEAREFAREVNMKMPGILARRAGQLGANAAPFRVLERFHVAIATVTIAAATVFLLALTIMLVDERRETVGVLRLIGLPIRRILAQVLLEGIFVSGAGALFGLLLAVVSQALINRFFQWRYDTALIFVRITPDVAATCAAIAIPLGAAATVLASWALLRRNGLRLARR